MTKRASRGHFQDFYESSFFNNLGNVSIVKMQSPWLYSFKVKVQFYMQQLSVSSKIKDCHANNRNWFFTTWVANGWYSDDYAKRTLYVIVYIANYCIYITV